QAGIRFALAARIRYSLGRCNHDSWFWHKRTLDRGNDGCSRVHSNPRKGKFKTPSSWSLYDGSVCLISRRKLPLESLSGGHFHANRYLHSALVTRVVDLGTRPKRSGTEAINAGLCLWNLRFGNRHDTQVSFSSGGSLPALRRCTVGRERSWTHDGV